jgi:hypothetical protein
VLRELEFDVGTRSASRFGFHDLANDFFLRFLVGQKNELARNKGCGDADNGAVRKDEDSLR